MGCSTLAFGQTVEQRMDSLQLLIGQQTILHLKATARKGAKVVMPSFKPGIRANRAVRRLPMFFSVITIPEGNFPSPSIEVPTS